jgi:hypothetical protein
MLTRTQRYDVARRNGETVGWDVLEVTVSGEPGENGILFGEERFDDMVDDIVTALIVGEFPDLEEVVGSAEETSENVCRWVYTMLARAIRAERKRLGITLDMDLLLDNVRLYESAQVWVTVG